MVESLSNNADKSDVDAEVEEHRSTEVHDQPQPPDGKGEPGGVAELDDNGSVRSGQVPSLAVTNTFTVTNESDLTNLNTAEIGDVGIVTSQSRSYILTGDYSTLSNWTEFESPPAPVDDVNGQTGSVSLGAGDVGAEPSGAVEDHRTGETHTTAQPAQTHGNEDHNATFAEDGDPQPPQNHGNGAHTTNYLDSNDYNPEADTHSRYTDGEARNALASGDAIQFPSYPTTGDVPNISEGEAVYVSGDGALYVEDGT
jgi:hypothetical protein